MAVLALGVAGLGAAPNSPASAAPLPALLNAEDVEAVEVAPVLDPKRSTETTTTYRHPDGSYRLEASLDAVNFQDDAGEWQVIDNDLVDSAGSTFAVENAENDFTAQLPADASAAPIKVTSDEGTISMRMHGVDAAPEVEGATATYDDVEGASEVVYEVTGSGVKENIVLDQAPATGSAPLSYAYTMKLSTGLTPRLVDDGSVQVRKADGTTAFVIPAGNMSDSATPEAGLSLDVDYALAVAGDAWTLTVTPDMGWLTDPARAYPVRIDPTVLTKSIMRNCWLGQANPTTNGCGANASYLRAGGGSGQIRRTILDFDTTPIPTEASVSSADLNMYLYSSQGTSNATVDYGLYRPGKAWDSGATWSGTGISTTTWTGGDPSGQASNTTLPINGATSGYKTFNATTFVTAWRSGAWERNGIMIRQIAESSPNTYVAFASGGHPTAAGRPELVVNYTMPPAPVPAPVILSPSPGGPQFATTPRPQFSATVGSSVNTVEFSLSESGQTIWTETASVNSGRATATPTADLSPYKPYLLTARAATADAISALASYEVQLDSMAPVSPAPQCTTPCAPVGPSLLFDASVSPSSNHTIDVNSLGDMEDFDSVQVRVTGGAGTSGPSKVFLYNPDYVRPVLPAFVSDGPFDRTLEVTLSNANDLRVIVERADGAPVPLQVQATGRTLWYEGDAKTELDNLETGEFADADIVPPVLEYRPADIQDFEPLTAAAMTEMGDDPSICNDDYSDSGPCGDQSLTADQAWAFVANSPEGSVVAADRTEFDADRAEAIDTANRPTGCRNNAWGYTGRFGACRIRQISVTAYQVPGGKEVGRGIVFATDSILLSDLPAANAKIRWVTTVTLASTSSGVIRTNGVTVSQRVTCGACKGGYQWDSVNLRPGASNYKNLDTYSEPRYSTGSVIKYVTGMRSRLRVTSPVAIGQKDSYATAPEMRCDYLTYNKQFSLPEGCVMPNYTPTWSVDRNSSPELSVHVRQAQADNYAQVMTRADVAQQKLNTRVQRRLCRPKQAAATQGQQCDEYPMKATNQGCGSVTPRTPPCSVKYIDGKQNGSGGGKFGYFLRNNRILRSVDFPAGFKDRFVVRP